MRRSVLTLALVSLCSLSVASVVAQGPLIAVPLVASAGTSAAEHEAGARSIDDAVATAVIAAVTRQFSEQNVAVKLDSVQLQPASLRDRTVGGYGRLRMGQDASWIPFRFEALYDTESAAVSHPRLALGQAQGSSEIAVDSDLGSALTREARSALSAEFSQQPFDLVVDRVVTQVAGDRLVQVRGSGTVDFGPEGSTAAQIDALYDPAEGRWLRLEYQLGTESAWDTASAPLAANL